MPITSSSISSSEALRAGEPRAGRWRRFALTLAAWTAALLAAALAVAWLIDPYDTGRTPLPLKPGVRHQGARTAAASRGRDPAFDAAIFGNSRVQLLSPERLDRLTGLSFVQLSVPGTMPKEQFLLIDWFLRHHPQARALVIGADPWWCTADPAMPNHYPFPFWLFSRSPLEYGRGLLRFEVLTEIPRRVTYLLSPRKTRARPDGYSDYELLPITGVQATDPRAEPVNTTGRFPVAERLREAVAAFPPRLAVVIVFPPISATLLPEPGSSAEAADRACKAALAAALAGRANAGVADWRRDRPELHVADWFLDPTHYRRPLAELVERDIAETLTRR